MKFYIIGGHSPQIKCNINKREFIYNFDNLDDAFDKFNTSLSSRMDIDYAYLIVDFEIYKYKSWKYAAMDTDHIPFLIIAEYNYKNLRDITIRRDSLILITKGFTQQYSNNLEAIKQFEYYYENNIDCELYVSLKRPSSNGEPMTIFVASIDKMRTAKTKLTRILVQPITWVPDYVIKTRRNFTYKPHSIID